MTKRECAFAGKSEYLAALLILLTVYFFAGNLGLKLAFVHASATAVWPPTGIALAGLLVLGYRVWPAIFLGAFLVNVTTDGSVATSIGIATGNTLEGLLGAYLVRRFAGGRDAFNQPRTVFKFAALAGAVSTTVSATIGVASLLLGGSASWGNSGAIWLTWWLGDTAGALIVAPLLILWSARRGLLWSRARAFEATLLLLVLILVGQVEFAGLVPAGVKNYPLSFLCLPPVVWAAFRFGQRETVTVACLLSGIAIWGTLHGYGPFVGGTPNESLIFLQAFMGVLAVMALAVAAVVAEQRHAEEALRKAHDELERRVAERTDELAKANHALQASREQLAEAQQIAQVGSWEWDIAKNIVSWSDEMYRNYGLKPQGVSLTQERFVEFVHPDDRSFVREIVERAVRDHKSFAFDHRIVRPDGTERIIHARGEVIVDEAGHALRMIGTGQDITERKLAEAALVCGRDELEERVQERTAELTAANDAFLAEIVEHKQTAEALRDSQTKFQAIFENSIDAIAVSKNGVHVLVNPAYLKMFGHSQAEEVVGRPVLESIAPSQRETIRERIQHRATGEAAPTHYETRGLRRDGAEFDLEVDVSSYKLKGEIYTLVILRDATKRKQAERSLRESEALKRAILESALDGIVAMDHEGKMIEWNPAAERTFGYRRADVLGRDMSELIIPLGLREKHRRGLARFLSTGKGDVVGKRVEMTGRRADGSEFPVELAITLIERDGLPAFTGYARDITERKRAEEEIRKLNTELEQRVIERTAQLEAINNELESFTYSVSHDLRAPLRAMQGLAAALLEDYQERLDETGRDYARRIQIAASRMETLIQDLLAYSRLSRMDVELRAVELDSVLAEVRSQLEVDLRDRDATVVIESPLPLVVGHRATLVQVFSNLISNGVKFVAPGVAPRLRIHPEERGKAVRLWVEDNGIGIAPEYHERVFRIFERLHGVETYPGTGIGLAIVQKGAARLGGRVGVESTEGEGSRFWVELTKANV